MPAPGRCRRGAGGRRCGGAGRGRRSAGAGDESTRTAGHHREPDRDDDAGDAGAGRSGAGAAHHAPPVVLAGCRRRGRGRRPIGVAVENPNHTRPDCPTDPVPAMTRKQTGRRSLSILALLLGLAGCTKEESLVLLDLRPSGPLGAPVARIRLSAKGWPERPVEGTLDAAGFRVGYYGPGDGSAVTVTAEALDAGDCVLGSGSATVRRSRTGRPARPRRCSSGRSPPTAASPTPARTPVAKTPAATRPSTRARTPRTMREPTQPRMPRRMRASMRPTRRGRMPRPMPARPTPMTTTPPRMRPLTGGSNPLAPRSGERVRVRGPRRA